MSKFVSVVLGAAVLATSFGVAQFATGQDLSGTRTATASISQGDYVNRSAKTDRAVGMAVSKSVTFIQPSVPNVGAQTSRRPVACEAPASVLTDIAKQMASGRCIT